MVGVVRKLHNKTINLKKNKKKKKKKKKKPKAAMVSSSH